MTTDTLTPEQMEVVNDSDAVCDCGANPREAETLAGWFIDTVPTHDAVVAVMRCPRCWWGAAEQRPRPVLETPTEAWPLSPPFPVRKGVARWLNAILL